VTLEPVAGTLVNSMILRQFGLNSQDRSIRELYGAIVAQARSVAFYSAYGVPDTVEGRFDLIVLHIVLLLARLDRNGSSARGIGQKLFDAFCRDLDANLREMGVGDLAVPKRMRHFGEAFYGRQAAYLAALAARDDRELENALARNIFSAVNGGGASRLARYARAVLRDFEVGDEAALLRGESSFRSRRLLRMSDHKSRDFIAPPWRVPVAVEEIADSGQRFDLVADESVRAAVAKVAGLRDLPRFEANFDVTRRGASGLHVTGKISATVGQICVVTLEPLANEVEETVDVLFEPSSTAPETERKAELQLRDIKSDDPESLIGGIVDLGVLGTEFLLLGLDLYPRKPGAVFEPSHESKPDNGPFAALAQLAKRPDSR
jgi:hypothetical protein